MRCRSVFAALSISLYLVVSAYGACQDGTHSAGAVYRVCLPSGPWNGDLILYAHGFVAPGEPIAIPENQLKLPDGTYLPDLITGLGYGFATTSYSRNGLAVPEGVAEISELPAIFTAYAGRAPGRVFVTGVSEGALVAARALEINPALFNGGLAACGPIGDFRKQVDYIGDLRVVFDYFFPGLLPPTAISIPSELVNAWESKYLPLVTTKLQQRPLATAQVISVSRTPVGLNPANAADAITSVLWYNVFATNDTVSKFGGNPFDNRKRWYSGSLSDTLLNLRVARFEASPAALEYLEKNYQTSGRLSRPLITLHTIWDPVVPYWHEALYAGKVQAAHSDGYLIQVPVARYGHCNFTSAEVLFSFLLMVLNPLAR